MTQFLHDLKYWCFFSVFMYCCLFFLTGCEDYELRKYNSEQAIYSNDNAGDIYDSAELYKIRKQLELMNRLTVEQSSNYNCEYGADNE